MQVTEVEKLGFADGATLRFEVDHIPDTHQEWAQAIGELSLESLLSVDLSDKLLVPHPEKISYSMERSADGDKSRDWWAGDHLWHADGTRWDVQPVLTVIGCKKAGENAPETELLDTVALLDIIEQDGFWEEHMPDINPATARSIFADSTYFGEALPYLRELACEADQTLINARLAEDLEKLEEKLGRPVESLDDLADWHDLQHPPKTFPLIQTTWLDGYEAIFIDSGGRNRNIVSRGGKDFRKALYAIRERYLTGNQPYEYDLVRSIGWSANSCIMFPQIGTLHRAQPGNQHDRELHLGFLTDAQAAVNWLQEQAAA